MTTSCVFPEDMDKKERAEAISLMLKEIESEMREEDFQRDFFESLQNQFYDRGSLSEKQFASLEKIYNRVTDI